jgi:hypothetical protein
VSKALIRSTKRPPPSCVVFVGQGWNAHRQCNASWHPMGINCHFALLVPKFVSNLDATMEPITVAVKSVRHMPRHLFKKSHCFPFPFYRIVRVVVCHSVQSYWLDGRIAANDFSYIVNCFSWQIFQHIRCYSGDSCDCAIFLFYK